MKQTLMVTSELWMIHVQGPDDVVAAPSKADAERVADAMNRFYGDYAARRRAEIAANGGDRDNFPEIKAVVRPWEGTRAGHVTSVEHYWSEYAEYVSYESRG